MYAQLVVVEGCLGLVDIVLKRSMATNALILGCLVPKPSPGSVRPCVWIDFDLKFGGSKPFFP